MKNKYDIGIFGLWYGNNYGSIITYYALSKVLDSFGKTYAMICNPLGIEHDIDSLSRMHPLRFAKEKYQITKLRKLDELSELNDDFDSFLIGSDQMWNIYLSRPYKQSYFLDFANDDKIKVAYATSFGIENYIGTKEEKTITMKNLHRFDAISVRDDFSKQICDEVFDISAEITVDPVFLCPVEKYDELIGEVGDFHIDGNYIFAYILDPNPQIGQSLQKISRENKTKIVVVFDLNGNKDNQRNALQITDGDIDFILDATVKEWLYLFRNSSFVLTDSFHGSCFSIIFKKPFIVMKNNKRGGKRFPFLLGNLGLLDRMVETPEDIYIKFNETGLDCKIDYKKVHRYMDKEKKRSLRWFENALSKKTAKPNAVTSLLNPRMCIGCGACVSKCPNSALSLKSDKWGYYISTLNHELCSDCGLCSKVCPAVSLPKKTNKMDPLCYAFIASDENILEHSSSGGIFPLLACEAFKRQGVVAGAAWKDDFSVEHIIIDNENELSKLQKSKYLQSYLGDTDKKIKQELDSGKFVLFSGCPCQIAGLKSYLGKDYENLLTIDLLCGNSPSTGFFKSYLKDSFPDGIKDYAFRNKSKGWDAFHVEVTFDNGEKIVKDRSNDDYQKLYHSHVMAPPHCEQCKYQELPRFGDITIGDFWGYSKHDNTVDTSKGLSVILCNNKKGQEYFNSIPEDKIRLKKQVPLEWIGGNGFAIKGHNYASPHRDSFYKAIQTMTFSKAMESALQSNADSTKSNFPDSSKLPPLHYDTKQLRFRFDSNMWEEHFINGCTVLTTKAKRPDFGYYASISLTHPLKKGKKYLLMIRFKIKTTCPILSLHIKETGSKRLQIIYSYNVTPKDSSEWVALKIQFIPNNNIYDEFMIGAAHITGEGRFLAIDYIDISEVS